MTTTRVNQDKSTGREFSYYPGCSLHSSAREYDVSTKAVCRKLGIELRELKDWICCGASSAHSKDRLLGVALPAHSLKLAEDSGLPLVVPCAMCFSRLKFAAHEMKNKDVSDAVNKTIEGGVAGTAVVEPLLKILADENLPLQVSKSLAGLKVACYYGCLLVRPHSVVEFDDEENPQLMDRLMERLGAQAVDWGLKTSCCGAGMPIARPDIVIKLSHRILSQAMESGAECIAVACPMCHSNLDMYQKDMKAQSGEKVNIPVFYFTELMGLALGLSPREVLVDKHLTDAMPLLRSKGLA